MNDVYTFVKVNDATLLTSDQSGTNLTSVLPEMANRIQCILNSTPVNLHKKGKYLWI